MIEEPNRVMYRAPRAIDVAMTAAATMEARMAVDKRVTAARGDLSAATTEDGLRTEKPTASPAAWARPESRLERVCVRERLGARSEAARYALAPLTVARRARADHFPLGDSAIARSVTPVRSDRSRGEGNSIR